LNTEDNRKGDYLTAEVILDFLSFIGVIVLIFGIIFIFIVEFNRDDIWYNNGFFEYLKQKIVSIFLMVIGSITLLFTYFRRKIVKRAKKVDE